jgi:type 1 glutamine amidotransferase
MRRLGFVFLGLSMWALAGCAPSDEPPSRPREDRVLVFSATAGFRHESIPEGVNAIRDLGAEGGFAVDATEDAGAFEDDNLARYRAVIFLNTTGDVLPPDRQEALERYVRRGGGFVGIHAAADTEYGWPFYGALLGARFKSHPEVQQATVRLTDRTHPSTTGLPELWVRTDEWYNFEDDPSERVHVLALLDEITYSGGEMGSRHPIAWCQEHGGGRSWYTGGGHTTESYREPLFRKHLLGAILWAAGRAEGDC